MGAGKARHGPEPSVAHHAEPGSWFLFVLETVPPDTVRAGLTAVAGRPQFVHDGPGRVEDAQRRRAGEGLVQLSRVAQPARRARSDRVRREEEQSVEVTEETRMAEEKVRAEGEELDAGAIFARFLGNEHGVRR